MDLTNTEATWMAAIIAIVALIIMVAAPIDRALIARRQRRAYSRHEQTEARR